MEYSGYIYYDTRSIFFDENYVVQHLHSTLLKGFKGYFYTNFNHFTLNHYQNEKDSCIYLIISIFGFNGRL